VPARAPTSQLVIARAISIVAKALRFKTWHEHLIKELSEILPGVKQEVAHAVARRTSSFSSRELWRMASCRKLCRYLLHTSRGPERGLQQRRRKIYLDTHRVY